MTKPYLFGLIISLLVAGLVGIFVINKFVFAQQEIQLSEASCIANTAQELKACIKKAKEKLVDLIRINKPIVCHNRDDCNFLIDDISQALLLYGVDRKTNDFIRLDDYSYPLLTILNSNNVKLIDLAFNDAKNTDCFTSNGNCKSVIEVNNSNLITFDNISINNSKEAAIKITNSRNITVKKSRFIDAYKNGIQVSSEGDTENIQILNNNFVNNASNAVIFSGKSPATAPSSISYNIFQNNHSGASYLNCPYPCLGGQIRIDNNTNNIQVIGNRITREGDVKFDLAGFFTSGIELGSQNIKNINFSCNEITQNSGSGIVQAEPVTGAENIRITENKLYRNGVNLNIFRTIETNNCFSEVCYLSCPTIKNPK